MNRIGIVLVLVAAFACERKKEQPTSEPVGTNMSGTRPRGMANCPSAVLGATTTITPTPDGILVTVTSDDRAAARRIAELAQFHAAAPTRPAVAQHNGARGGPARIGYCPTVHAGVKSSVIELPNGARVHLSADTPERVKELRDVTKARAERLPGFTSS